MTEQPFRTDLDYYAERADGLLASARDALYDSDPAGWAAQFGHAEVAERLRRR